MTVWVWDASALHHAAAADRLDVLVDIAKGIPDAPTRNVTTTQVVQELTNNGLWLPCAAHLDVVELETLEAVQVLAGWLDIVSQGERSRGEATVFAWAQINGGMAIVDDRDARDAALSHGLTVHGTLWILAQAIAYNRLTAAAADILVEALRATGARFPSFPAGGIASWARQNGLLAP